MVSKDALSKMGPSPSPPPPSKHRGKPAAGIAESPERLREYLVAHGVSVTRVDSKPVGTVLILDGCPMNAVHGRNGDTAVILRPDGQIGFECKHNSCIAFTWKQLRTKIDPCYAEGRAADPEGVTPWDLPIPLGQPLVPEFTLDSIPEELCAFCAMCGEVEESFQVPVDLPALLGLAVAGAALAKKVEVHVSGDHQEPVNLFVAIALEPANRKSGVFRIMAEPLNRFEAAECERMREAVARNQSERRVLQAALTRAEQIAAKADANERDAALEEVKTCREAFLALPEIIPPQLIADDATPEAVSRLLAEQGGRIALLSPEGDTFDLMGGRYDAKGRANLGVYLKGHAGDDVKVNRIGRPRESVPKAALTIGLAVQPEVLRGLLQKPGFRGKGLLARFLFSIPKSRLGTRKVQTTPVTPPTRRAYDELLLAALRLEPKDESDRPTTFLVRMSPEALKECVRFAREVETELGASGKFAEMRDWAGKLVGLVARIAGILHGLRYAATGRPDQVLIDQETAMCAISIGQYAVSHAKAAFLMMGADTATLLAERLLVWIADESMTEFTRRDAFMRLRGTIQRAAEIDPVLRLLEDHGFIRERATERSGPGRKPSPNFEVNPSYLARKAQNAQNDDAGINSAHSADSAQEVAP